MAKKTETEALTTTEAASETKTTAKKASSAKNATTAKSAAKTTEKPATAKSVETKTAAKKSGAAKTAADSSKKSDKNKTSDDEYTFLTDGGVDDAASKEIPVENKLFLLYTLQTVVSDIDKIKTLRGELPLEVQDLEDEIVGLKTRLDKYYAEIRELDDNITGYKNKISESQLLIERYKGQLDQVRNNREFDTLSKEVEYQELEVEFSEKKIKEYHATIKQKRESIAGIKEILEGRKIDLSQKEKELQDIVAETRVEEDKLREKAKSVEEKIETRLLNAFKRIRKGARNGLAVVNIERDACGGCFNKIPPQKQLDIKLRKKILVCEYCGRIMIDPDLANDQKLS